MCLLTDVLRLMPTMARYARSLLLKSSRSVSLPLKVMATLAVVLSWLSSCLLSKTYAPYRGLFIIVFSFLYFMTFDFLYQRWVSYSHHSQSIDQFIDHIFACEGVYIDNGWDLLDDELIMNLFTKDEFLFLLDECEKLCPSS